MRFKFDKQKSEKLRKNPKRKIGFEEAAEVWEHPWYEDLRSDNPEQFRAIGWVRNRLYSVIYELREDGEGEYYHLVTLWKATREEERLYERNL
jgi:uncharacterized DUF497 family protein